VIGAEDFESFYRDTLPRLEKFVVRLAGSRAIAEEIVQETYYRFLRSRFEGASDEERRRYLYRIAVNLAKNHWSRRRSEETIDVIAHTDASNAIDVNGVLARMQPRERAMLWLAYAEGCSHREIAEVMEVSALSVRVLLSRARKRFVELMSR
jgi:RNA polymerase sigma-70 factor (ECF subfamily)